MITEIERTRLKKFLSDAISLLCRSGLPGAYAHRVDALIGITLDNHDVVLVNFSENFLPESECLGREAVIVERNYDTHSSQVPEKLETSVSRCYDVKSENKPSPSQDLYNTSTVGSDRIYGTDVAASNLHDRYLSAGDRMQLQESQSTNKASAIDNIPSESEKSPAYESDTDCLFIKAELRDDDDSGLSNIHSVNETVVAPYAKRIALPSAVPRSSYSVAVPRIKHVRSLQRRHNLYASKFNRTPQRHNTVQQNISNLTEVSPHTNNTSSMLQSYNSANSIPQHGSSGDDSNRGAMNVRELLQCSVCGAWLRGRQTLNEHIRGRHLSIYNYHCKYCGLSFKWRSAHRNHQLNCSVSQSH